MVDRKQMMDSKIEESQILTTNLLPPCKICGEAGTGFHYGVTTCGACKGFFRRSIIRHKDYRCSQNNLCKVGPSTNRRQSCPKCRYEKCLAVGMCKEACKIGRYTLIKKSEDIKEAIKHYKSIQSDKPSITTKGNANQEQKVVVQSNNGRAPVPKQFSDSTTKPGSSKTLPNANTISTICNSKASSSHAPLFDDHRFSSEEQSIVMYPSEDCNSKIYDPNFEENNYSHLNTLDNDCFTFSISNGSGSEFNIDSVINDSTIETNNANNHSGPLYTTLEPTANFDSLTSWINSQTPNSHQTTFSTTNQFVNAEEQFPHQQATSVDSPWHKTNQNTNYTGQLCSTYILSNIIEVNV